MKTIISFALTLIASAAVFGQHANPWRPNATKIVKITGDIQDVSIGKHRNLVATSGKWMITIYDKKQKTCFVPYYRHDGDMQGSARFSPDGRYVAYYGLEQLPESSKDWSPRVTDIFVARTKDGSLVKVLPVAKYYQAPVFNNIVWRGNSIIISTDRSNFVAWYPTQPGVVIRTKKL